MGSLGIAKSLRRAKPDIDELAAAYTKDKERRQREESIAALNNLIQSKLHPKPPITRGVGPDEEKMAAEVGGAITTPGTPKKNYTTGEDWLGGLDFDPTTPEFLSEVGRILKRKPEETLGDIVESYLTKVKARRPSRKTVNQIIGRDGYYYNVVEDQQTGETKYEKTDIEAPTTKYERAPSKKKVDRIIGEDGFYYEAVTDEDTGETSYKKTDIKAPAKEYERAPQKEEKETYQTSFITADGQIITRRYVGTPQKVAKDMRARLKAVTDIIKDLENTKEDDELLQLYRRELAELNTSLDELQENGEATAGSVGPEKTSKGNETIKPDDLPSPRPGENKAQYIKRLRSLGYEITD